MTPKISVGVIGAGYWGKNLLRNFDSLGSLFGFSDTSQEQRALFGEQYSNATVFSDLDSMLDSPDISAVAIATPAATHAGIAKKALLAGKHVFVEKPLCLEVEAGEELKKIADDRKLTLMVGHLLLYHPAFIALKELVDCGKLGTLRYITSNRLSLGKIRREENALWSFAPHDISMILSLTGRMPSKISTNGGSYLTPPVADTTLSHLTFSNELQAHIFVSWLHPFKDHKLVVIGSEAMAVLDDVKQGPEKLVLYKHAVGWEGDVPTVNKADAEPIPYETSEPLRAECQHFLDCIASGELPRSDAAEGLRVLTVLDGCQASLTQGTPIEL